MKNKNKETKGVNSTVPVQEPPKKPRQTRPK